MYQVAPNTQNLLQAATKATCIRGAKNMQSLLQPRLSAVPSLKITIHQIIINHVRVMSTRFQIRRIQEPILSLQIQIHGTQMFRLRVINREIIIHHQSRIIVFQHLPVLTTARLVRQNRVVEHQLQPDRGAVTLHLPAQAEVVQHRHGRAAVFHLQAAEAVHQVVRRVVRQEAHPEDQAVHPEDPRVEVAAGNNNKSFLYLFNPLKF